MVPTDIKRNLHDIVLQFFKWVGHILIYFCNIAGTLLHCYNIQWYTIVYTSRYTGWYIVTVLYVTMVH